MGNNKEFKGMMKNKLCGKIMKEILPLRPTMYSYLTDDGNVDKKAKGARKCVINFVTTYAYGYGC